MSVYKNIENFLAQKSSRIQSLPLRPIILKWLNSPSMKKSLQIIDKKVAYLVQEYQHGGEGKLIQWFLSNDVDFVTITAERYIIDYLVSQNSNIQDNLGKKGIDAILRLENEKVGIEVTTVNGFIAEWILVERLTELLDSKHIIDDKSLRIEYDYQRIVQETQQNRIYQYLDNVSTAIETKDHERLKSLDVSVEFDQIRSGLISWNHNQAQNFPWLKYLTTDLFAKLSESNKKKQLMLYPKNIIFIGVNHIAPSNWVIPSIFQEIGRGGASYSSQIKGIETYWVKVMQDFNCIKGICFFYYSLERNDPFYPLRIFWSNEGGRLPINL